MTVDPMSVGGEFGGEDKITVRSFISLSKQPKQRSITRRICQTFGLEIVFGRGGLSKLRLQIEKGREGQASVFDALRNRDGMDILGILQVSSVSKHREEAHN